ncbi:hypothetical protein PGT21_012426 [Puccinia graminis f. sp. tritici]|uniref:Uncharacterized protein n=1 Tax=Puccinia graminis f. sp. tritici TaxID=56615 RepID=A0A5B0NA22_PUCGR|nr:hypothetical protein PGT21_012426 [Puccinia graminis f. sp. tritici]KAA1136007.1 hypothetical protein PGTUg99_020572 [Puccinia graminis f. sp. tritici]
MQFFNVFSICLLLLVFSDATHSKFLCDDKSRPTAKLGVCLREIRNKDHYDVVLRRKLTGKKFLLTDAEPEGKGFTCAFRTIRRDRIPLRGYCCNLPHDVLIRTMTAQSVKKLCYPHDRKHEKSKGSGGYSSMFHKAPKS